MVRKVCITDAADIVSIYNKYIMDTTVSFETEPLTVEQMMQRITDISRNFPYFVYQSDGRILGYAYVHKWKERAAYCKTLETTIYLDAGAKHSGIGTMLMEKLVNECRQLGYKALIACITGENHESIAFHENIGFKQVSRFRNVGEKFGRMLDVVDFELEL